ncbi:MAG: RsmD family RNA methyltransferase [Planctomycetota bacterium]
MTRYKKGRDLKRWKTPRLEADSGKLRIIGGQYGGRQIEYSGDPVTRPMKDDVREALFNLVGGWTPGKAAFDLFAGSGAIGLEALSRGATQAFFIERHFPTAKIIRENIESLDPHMNSTVAPSDSFFWTRRFFKNQSAWPTEPWIVFLCPPYEMFVTRTTDLLEMISCFKDSAPSESIIVVESDDRFDVDQLPNSKDWSIRQYSPALISIFKKFE